MSTMARRPHPDPSTRRSRGTELRVDPVGEPVSPRTVRATVTTLLFALALAACGPAEDLRGPAPATKPTETARQTATVRRGTIAEVVKGTGRVASLNETPAYFRTAGRIRTVNVE